MPEPFVLTIQLIYRFSKYVCNSTWKILLVRYAMYFLVLFLQKLLFPRSSQFELLFAKFMII